MVWKISTSEFFLVTKHDLRDVLFRSSGKDTLQNDRNFTNWREENSLKRTSQRLRSGTKKTRLTEIFHAIYNNQGAEHTHLLVPIRGLTLVRPFPYLRSNLGFYDVHEGISYETHLNSEQRKLWSSYSHALSKNLVWVGIYHNLIEDLQVEKQKIHPTHYQIEH